MSIPADIRKLAEAVVDRGYNVGLIAAVSGALVAERERAARIAEGPVFVRPECCRDTADAIAAAIRTPDTPPATQDAEDTKP